ncbi:MAG: DNA repair protein RadA [Candidatus Margulisiibacteriota bacterium]|jgi:DNA repair protein RadA/Sms
MPTVKYVCQSCGAVSPRWIGKCPECSGWNTFVEEFQDTRKKSLTKGQTFTEPQELSAIKVNSEIRTATGLAEFDRVLGGGLVQGAAILLGGDPGIGKSTIALQIAGNLDSQVLYISGEESLQQLKLRADRLGRGKHIQVLAETNLAAIENSLLNTSVKLVVLDSIQSIYWEDLPSAPGSVGQVRECSARLIRIAKEKGFAILLIGHVTKEGSIAGPKVLEHMVDTVLYFEGDRNKQFRIIRAFKNRFGSTNEIGIFEMQETGLVEVKDPSLVFLQDRNSNEPGSVVVAAMEGSRPFLVEIQALVAPSSGFGAPRRTVSGVDYNRLAIILAILERKAGLKLSMQDVFINVVGGVEVTEPAADLAIALAVTSSLRNRPLPPLTAVFGELGLGGEIRPVSQSEARLQEISKIGFKKVILPVSKYSKKAFSGLEALEVSKIWEEIF